MPEAQRDALIREALAEAQAIIQQERDQVFDEEIPN